MKTCIYKESLGGGYGINRSVSPEKALSTAVPPYGNVSRNSPGRGNPSETGKTGKRHYDGAKIEKRTA
jgi:hypothetical protein